MQTLAVPTREEIQESAKKGIEEFFQTKSEAQAFIRSLFPEAMNEPDDLLTREEVAKAFRVTVPTIDKYRNQGLMTFVRIGGMVRIRRKHVQEFIEQHTIYPDA